MHRQNFNAIGLFRRAGGLPKHAYVFGNKVAEKWVLVVLFNFRKLFKMKITRLLGHAFRRLPTQRYLSVKKKMEFDFLVLTSDSWPLLTFALKQCANALDLSTVQALNLLRVFWDAIEQGVQIKSTMTQHVEHSEVFTKAHVESWLRIFGYTGYCACVGSTFWALLCKCTRLCWATHGWPRIKGDVEPCWAKSSTSFTFDSTRLSTGCSNPLNLLSSTCWQLVQWTNPVHLQAA